MKMKALFIACAILLGGCATTVVKAAQTVAVGAHIQMDVEDAVVAIDNQQKQMWVAKVSAGQMTSDEALKANADWEVKLGKVITANKVLRDALKTAGHLVDAGNVASNKDYQAAVDAVASAAASLLQALSDAGIHIKGVN
jgi:hypothetical protein